MNQTKNPVSLLIAEDDDDYYLLIKEVMEELAYDAQTQRFVNGEELLNYLSARPRPEPTVIIMDLNMPKKTGHEALRDIRANPVLQKIPVVVMTVSSDPNDIARCYKSGANSFITKPFDFEQLLETFRTFKKYWLERVSLPSS